jgi:hypothetical protein
MDFGTVVITVIMLFIIIGVLLGRRDQQHGGSGYGSSGSDAMLYHTYYGSGDSDDRGDYGDSGSYSDSGGDSGGGDSGGGDGGGE